mgnify:FL=1
MRTSTPTSPLERRDRQLKEEVHDVYKQSGQLKGPARCPECSAVYHKGRWSWTAQADDEANKIVCASCRRIADNYPAGEVSLEGAFVTRHKDEILNLMRNIEVAENREHPMNRIIDIRQAHNQLLVTTTDVHLPRRIGKAVQKAWEGSLDVHFDKGGYFTRITWCRES